MAQDDERVHALAVAIIQDCGEYAQGWALRRVTNMRSEGDWQRAEFWQRVATMVAEIQARPSDGRYH